MSRKATKRPTPGHRALVALRPDHAHVRGDDTGGMATQRKRPRLPVVGKGLTVTFSGAGKNSGEVLLVVKSASSDATDLASRRECAAKAPAVMWAPSCTEDEGRAPRSRPSGVGFKPLQAATVKSRGGEGCRKGGRKPSGNSAGERCIFLAACERTTGPRTRICQSEGASERCSGSGLEIKRSDF